MTEIMQEGNDIGKGFVMDYWQCQPEQLVVKIQGTLNENEVDIRVVVNAQQQGEMYFEDSAILDDGDRVYCEPDGLVVLRAGATDEQIELINESRVQIGTYFDGTFLSHPTVE